MADVAEHTPLITFMIITTLISFIVPASVIVLDKNVPINELSPFASLLVEFISDGLTGSLFQILLPNFFIDWTITYITAWAAIPVAITTIILIPLLVGTLWTIIKLLPTT